MKGVPVIKSFLGGVLLILFAFSITPKLALHDLLADHRDWSGVCAEPCKDHIEPTGPDCDCDHLVAESPFVLYEQASPLPVERVYADYAAFPFPAWHSCYHFFSEQRGPPAPLKGMPVFNA